MSRRLLVFLTAAAVLLLAALLVQAALVRAQPGSPEPAQATPDLFEPEGSLVLSPTTITWISGSEPDATHAGQSAMWVGYGPGDGSTTGALRGLVKFDLSRIPRNAHITSAKLYATISAAQEDPPDHFLYEVGHPLQSWDEAVTWYTAPSAQFHALTTDISATSGVVAWNVQYIIEELRKDTFPDYGLQIDRYHDQTDPQVHARRFSNLRLAVVFETPTPAPTTPALVSIANTDSVDPVVAGDVVQYVISLHNLTSGPLQNLQLQDVIPAGATFVEGSSGAVFDGDRTVTWRIGSLAVGIFQSASLTLRAGAALPDGTVLLNLATLSYPCPAGTCKAAALQTTTVRRLPTPTATATPPCPPDEAGVSFGTAAGLTAARTGAAGAICPTGDEDWYKFTVGAGEKIEGLLYGLPADYDAYLIRPDGSQQATFSNAGLQDEPIVWWGVTAAQAGAWRVKIFGSQGAFSSQPYHLTMQSTAPTASPTASRTPTGTPRPTATPTATRTRTPAASPTPTATPHEIVDLVVADAQAIQVISPGTLDGVDSPIPMLAGKYTAVRVLVDSGVHGTVPNVSGRLYYERAGVTAYVLPYNGPIDLPAKHSMAHEADTLNFFLPPAILSGEVRWWVEINGDRRVVESNYNNNRWPPNPGAQEDIRFEFGRSSWDIGYMEICWARTEGDPLTCPGDHTATGDDFINRAYPIASSAVDYYRVGKFNWYGSDWYALMAELNNKWDYERIHDPGHAPDQLFGWLGPDIFYGGGMSDPSWAGGRGVVAFANDNEAKYQRTIAHEIGHNLGPYHPCEDSDWPYTDYKTIRYTGFDPLAGYDGGSGLWPGGTEDIMTGGWCGADPYHDKWISPYTYKEFLTGLSATASAQAGLASSLAVGAGQTILLVTGAVNDDDSLRLFPVYQVVAPQAVTLQRPDPGAQYCVHQKDASGASLRSYCFDLPDRDTAEMSSVARSFAVPMLLEPALAEVAVQGRDTQRPARRVLSANAPQIGAVSPNGGENLTEPFSATWTANDLDGDKLTYAVLYSRDGGAHWRPLVTGLQTPTLTLDPALLAGSTQARLRVAATDGIRTTYRDSSGDFIVPAKPPVARIVFPRDGVQVTAGRPVTFLGRGFDPDEGPLTDDAGFTWVSSLAGGLGAGRLPAVETLAAGEHTITLTVTDSEGKTASDSIVVHVIAAEPPPCGAHDLAGNGGFEAGNLSSWQADGAPQPVVTAADKHAGGFSLLLGNPNQPLEAPGLSSVRRIVQVPAGAAQATLSFWYKVRAGDPGAGVTGSDYDWFGAYLFDPAGALSHQVVKVNANTGWLWAAYDLTPFAGQAIGIGFFVRNDGQGGAAHALVDDVVICSDAAPPQPPEPEACWLPRGRADYAPAGLPDFDQKQEDWAVSATGQWSHDGPAALADLLWWRDSAEEPGAVPPPERSDGYALVGSYGAWDDHDPQNVSPLIADLAARMATNRDHPGTDLEDLVAGVNGYLGDAAPAGDITVTVRRAPSFDWLREETKQTHQVLALLGFWELQPAGWRRLGGHYVGVAGVSCDADAIAFSDPFRNAAEAGWPGLVHSGAAPSGTGHNDAADVSHDTYGITRVAAGGAVGGWGPQGYVQAYADIANFAGLNFSAGLEAARAAGYGGGQIVTVVDYVVSLAPSSALVTLRLAPALSRVRAGQVFLVEMEVLAGGSRVDAVSAYLDFDPAVLRVVNENGDPASQIVPGSALPAVTANGAGNATGRIGFSASGEPVEGRFNLATVRFKAVAAADSTALAWSTTAPRQTAAKLGGAAVLGSLQDGAAAAGPSAFLTGQVSLQGRPASPAASWSVPLLLTLGRPGDRGPAYVFSATSGQDGAFTIPGVAEPGAYRVRLKSPHTLRNVLEKALAAGPNAVNMETLLEGDAFGDNRVNLRDVSLVAAAFGTTQGQAGFDPRADFNGDAAITQADVDLLKANLGRRGDVRVGAAVAAAAAGAALDLDLGAQVAGPVRLRLEPSSAAAAIGQIIVLDAAVDAGAQSVDTVEMYLDYDPAQLELVDASGFATAAIEPGASLPTVLLNHGDAALGWVDYLASRLGGTAPSGQFTVARLRFKLLQAGASWVRFSFSDWRTTDAAYRGDSVLGRVAAAALEGRQALPIYLPLVLKR